MSAACLLAWLLVGAGTPAETVRIMPRDAGTSADITALLPPNIAAKLPAGKLTQEQGEALLHLHLVHDGKEGPSILGTYNRQDKKLTFVPSYPLQAEQLYRVRFSPPGQAALALDYKVPPRPPTPAAEIVKLLPSVEMLPANHLRFYIHFSRPMRGGQDIFDQIYLLDANGKKIADPWLRDELWDEDGTMLILYIHPGRIKWDVLLRLLLGPVFEPERQYTLVIRGDMLDADGNKLGKDYRKKIRTAAEDRKRIDLAAWKVKPPGVGTKDPVAIDFPKVMDQLGLERFLKVVDAQGKTVGGKVEVVAGERGWKFHPAQAWTAQEYAVRVDERLEDVAGNTPLSAFDVDADAVPLAPQRLTLPFEPR